MSNIILFYIIYALFFLRSPNSTVIKHQNDLLQVDKSHGEFFYIKSTIPVQIESECTLINLELIIPKVKTQ